MCEEMFEGKLSGRKLLSRRLHGNLGDAGNTAGGHKE
jgi:hypothetical protein